MLKFPKQGCSIVSASENNRGMRVKLWRITTQKQQEKGDSSKKVRFKAEWRIDRT